MFQDVQVRIRITVTAHHNHQNMSINEQKTSGIYVMEATVALLRNNTSVTSKQAYIYVVFEINSKNTHITHHQLFN